MSAEWEHNPPETLIGNPWKVELNADGSLLLSCGTDDGLVYTLRIARDIVLDLGNAVRRNEVRRVLEQQKTGGAR